MPEQMKPYLPTVLLLLLIAYLGVQALTGERGLLSGSERDALLAKRQAQLALVETSHHFICRQRTLPLLLGIGVIPVGHQISPRDRLQKLTHAAGSRYPRQVVDRYLSSISELHSQEASEGSYSSQIFLPSKRSLLVLRRINSMPQRSLSKVPMVIEARLPLA